MVAETRTPSDCSRAFFKDFSVEGPTTKRDFRKKRKSGEVFPFGGLGEKIFVFLSSLDLISCNFSMMFAHFQTKRDITRGTKTLQWGGGGNIGAGGGEHMLKKALDCSKQLLFRFSCRHFIVLDTTRCHLLRTYFFRNAFWFMTSQ